LTRLFISPRFVAGGNPSGVTVTLNRPAPAAALSSPSSNKSAQQQIGSPSPTALWCPRQELGHLFDHPGKTATLTLEDAGS